MGNRMLLCLCALLLGAAPCALAAEPATAKLRPGQQPQGLVVFSIVPSQAEPGSRVVITGSAFTPTTTLLLGGNELPVRVIDARHLEFTVPNLPQGQYALSVRSDDGTARSYSYQVQALRPVAQSLEPDQVTTCNPLNEREVTVHGRNFSETSQVLFNGAIIRSRQQSGEAISFAVPPVAGGLHQVAIKTGDALSTPLGLSVVSTPVITGIARGNDRVNQYELLIDGSNFHQNSRLVVDGLQVGGPAGVQEERLSVQNCSRIVYLRRPVSSTPKNLNIQVVNPNGETSQVFSVFAP